MFMVELVHECQQFGRMPGISAKMIWIKQRPALTWIIFFNKPVNAVVFSSGIRRFDRSYTNHVLMGKGCLYQSCHHGAGACGAGNMCIIGKRGQLQNFRSALYAPIALSALGYDEVLR